MANALAEREPDISLLEPLPKDFRKAPPKALEALRVARELISQTKRRALKRAMSDLYEAVLSLWASNRWLQSRYVSAKVENMALHRLVSVMIQRYGEVRLSQQEFESVEWNRRIRAYLVADAPDAVVFREADGPVLVDETPAWLPAALEALPVPDLIKEGMPRFQPDFDIADLYLPE